MVTLSVAVTVTLYDPAEALVGLRFPLASIVNPFVTLVASRV
jgi:hypothetical protein